MLEQNTSTNQVLIRSWWSRSWSRTLIKSSWHSDSMVWCPRSVLFERIIALLEENQTRGLIPEPGLGSAALVAARQPDLCQHDPATLVSEQKTTLRGTSVEFDALWMRWQNSCLYDPDLDQEEAGFRRVKLENNRKQQGNKCWIYDTVGLLKSV